MPSFTRYCSPGRLTAGSPYPHISSAQALPTEEPTMPTVDARSLLPSGYEVKLSSMSAAGLRLELFLVANPNALSDNLDPSEFAADERFPYWAELWPSSLALAGFLARRGPLDGCSTLELGCGTGLAGVTAARLGAQVTFTDFEPDALAFARANHALNLGAPGRTRLLDWRDPPSDVTAELVIAADVLYERRFLKPFLGTLARVVRKGGIAYVAEPGRAIAENTVETLEREGFRRVLHLEEVSARGNTHGIWIHELHREER